jgi:putative hemolysin
MLIIISTILLSILASAFFSGIEIAYVTSNKFHIEIENKKGNFSYQLLSKLVKKPSRFIAAMLVGNNIALVIYGLFMPDLLHPVLGVISNEYVLLLLQTIASTILILVVAEFLPKAIFNTHSNTLLKVFAIPTQLFYWLFAPVVTLMIWVSNAVMKYILKTDTSHTQQVFDKVDLDNYIRERTDTSREEEDVDSEIQIFKNALDFSDRKTREFMVPRTEIEAIEINEGLDALKEKFIESSLSKILIYKESIDNIIGYTHSFELFKKPNNVKSILRPVSFIPESMAANEVLNLLIKERRSIAVVIDEFGGTSGLVTIEDIVEELFGEIDDEHDTEEMLEEEINEYEWLFSARNEIYYLNEKYDLQLEESENYSTLGGLILHHLERIPEKGERLNLQECQIEIIKVSNARIEEVRLIKQDN